MCHHKILLCVCQTCSDKACENWIVPTTIPFPLFPCHSCQTVSLLFTTVQHYLAVQFPGGPFLFLPYGHGSTPVKDSTVPLTAQNSLLLPPENQSTSREITDGLCVKNGGNVTLCLSTAMPLLFYIPASHFNFFPYMLKFIWLSRHLSICLDIIVKNAKSHTALHWNCGFNLTEL